MSDPREMEAAIEAVLFVSSEPVPRPRLLAMFEEEEREPAAAALDAVLARYAAGEGRGVMVEDVAGGVRLVTRPEMGTWLRRFFDVASAGKLSMAALETLAIVAYRQPITGPEIQELRSVSPSGVLKTLLEKRLVRIAGRKEVVGKPFLYATTREFLVHFGLNSLRDLPPLEEFEETFGSLAAGGAGGGAAESVEAAAAGAPGAGTAGEGAVREEPMAAAAGQASVGGLEEDLGVAAHGHAAAGRDGDGATGEDGQDAGSGERHEDDAAEAETRGARGERSPARAGGVAGWPLGGAGAGYGGLDEAGVGAEGAVGVEDVEDAEERFLREVAELEEREEEPAPTGSEVER